MQLRWIYEFQGTSLFQSLRFAPVLVSDRPSEAITSQPVPIFAIASLVRPPICGVKTRFGVERKQ